MAQQESVVVTSSIWTCESFIPPAETVQPIRKHDVVLSPIHFESNRGHVIVGWACSQAEKCGNSDCRYAKG